jgi:CubicO group peptidase (beta-lactamase class C family)
MDITNPAIAGFSAGRLARINSAMQRYLDRDQLAGMLTLVARHGQVVHMDRFGWANREAGQPMSFDTIFRIYSMTKPITSAAVMMLYEEGHFQLSDPISRFIPAFKDTKVYQLRSGVDFDLVPPQREITIRDLLTHTAGLSNGFDDHSAVYARYRQELRGKMEKEPETDLATAADVLGRLVEVISGQPFDAFLKTRIFDPLGMVDAGFYVPDEKHFRLAAVYGPAEGGGITQIEDLATSTYKKPRRFLSGGGGLVCTLADYYRFCQMVLNRGHLGDARLLAPKTVDLMLMDHLPVGVIHPGSPVYGFGLGGSVLLDVAGSQGYGSAGAWGWFGAANTWFRIDPKEDLLMILMTQYMPPFGLQVDTYFNNMVYQALED